MRPALEEIAVLERPGLALIAIDAEIARRRAGPHELPFPARRKSRAAEAAKPRFGRMSITCSGVLEPERSVLKRLIASDFA